MIGHTKLLPQASPRYVYGGNVHVGWDRRTPEQRREDELRFMMYLLTQTYLY